MAKRAIKDGKPLPVDRDFGEAVAHPKQLSPRKPGKKPRAWRMPG